MVQSNTYKWSQTGNKFIWTWIQQTNFLAPRLLWNAWIHFVVCAGTKFLYVALLQFLLRFLSGWQKNWKCACIIYICQVNIEEWYQQMKQQFLFEEKKNMYSWNILYQATVLSRNGILIVRLVYLKWVKYLEVFKALIWYFRDPSSFVKSQWNRWLNATTLDLKHHPRKRSALLVLEGKPPNVLPITPVILLPLVLAFCAFHYFV